jgi:hypothetical protein
MGEARPTASVLPGEMPITLPDAEHRFAMLASQSGLASREHQWCRS